MLSGSDKYMYIVQRTNKMYWILLTNMHEFLLFVWMGFS